MSDTLPGTATPDTVTPDTATPDTATELPPGYTTFDGAAGRVAVRTFTPPPDAPDVDHVVLIAHGYGEHLGRYDHVAAALGARGGLVVGPDHVGHGRSDGERALITDFEHVVDDLHAVAEQAVERAGGVPLVLLGHSLGGLIAARYAQRYPDELTALVLSSPVLGSWQDPIGLLALDEIPDTPIDPSTLSRDPAVGAAYLDDPLVYHGPFKDQTLRGIAGTLHVVGAGATLGPLPTMWLHGEADELVPLAETAAGISALAPEQLTTRIYPDARHELFNETNNDEVLADLTAFIDVAVTLGRPPTED